MKRIIYTSIAMCALVFGASSCEFIEPEWVTPIGLGAVENIVELPTADPGESNFKIVSDCDYEYRIIQGEEWLTVTNAAERKIDFSYTGNNGFKRSAKVEISAPGRKDTLTARQPGAYVEYLTIPDTQKTFDVSAQGAQFNVDFSTNILLKNITYEAGSAQIGKVQISKNSVFFEVLPTSSRDARSFTLSIYALDGWEQRVESVITINQAKLQ